MNTAVQRRRKRAYSKLLGKYSMVITLAFMLSLRFIAGGEQKPHLPATNTKSSSRAITPHSHPVKQPVWVSFKSRMRRNQLSVIR